MNLIQEELSKDYYRSMRLFLLTLVMFASVCLGDTKRISLEFEEKTISEVLELFQAKRIAKDPSTGAIFVTAAIASQDFRFSLKLTDIPEEMMLSYLCKYPNAGYVEDPYGNIYIYYAPLERVSFNKETSRVEYKRRDKKETED